MSFLSVDYQRTTIRKPHALFSGMDAYLHAIYGSAAYGLGICGELLAKAWEMDDLAPAFKDMADNVLRRNLLDFREALRRRRKGCEALLPRALAAVREAADRRVGLRPFVVQLAGALALHRGHIAEMATGEGKTLTAALAGVLDGWTGLPCHVITVNDYLADRDARWMGELYAFCDVSVSCVTAEMAAAERREAYARDVVYVTNKEVVADFLRDRLWLGSLQKVGRRQIAALLGRHREIESGLVTRGIHTAIVDEADSILIDEAVTPLIISRALPNEVFTEACQVADGLASGLTAGTDYRVDPKHKEVELDPATADRLAEEIRASGARFRAVGGQLELVHQALTAREFFHRDQQYVVQDGKVVIVDEFTGRQMPHRTWRAGLHQFIEAKERLPMTTPTETLARLSFQRFYRFFRKLSGMTATASEAAAELWDIYDLAVAPIPENRRCVRRVRPALAFADEASKWQAIVDEIVSLHGQGRPVLVGTRSVKASEHLASLLAPTGVWFRVLNAVRHAEEAAIIARAGEEGAVTVATNMAGRGTDIRLGAGVAERGGLHVIASECHESQRIDRQLFGRCARQGDPGSARLFISMEDEIIRRYVPGALRRLIGGQLASRVPGARHAAIAAVRAAQAATERLAFRRRRSVLRTDTWLDDSLSFAPDVS